MREAAPRPGEHESGRAGECTIVRIDRRLPMKAARFEYVRPASVEEACAALRSHDDARLIAGGQTLVPMMAMRLARPSLLIDIGRLSELRGISHQADVLVVGACTRQVEAERSALVGQHNPLLALALPFVGHAPTRNRGTLGGSVANADPAAEIPLVLATLGGEVEFQTADSTGRISAHEVFEGPMMTSLAADACLTRLRFPIWSGTHVGAGFHEVSARQSDFAYVSAAAQVALDDDGRIIRCALGVGGATPVPTALRDLAQDMVGCDPAQDTWRDGLRAAVDRLEIMVDAHASRAYRKRVAAHLVERAFRDACHRAAKMDRSDPA
jgi:CO/xanthine dehydrogenase FAD-binding subunit